MGHTGLVAFGVYRCKRLSALVVFLAGALTLLAALPAVAAGAEPKDTVRLAVDEITAILTNQELAVPENRERRYRSVVAVVEKFFDFSEISMRTLGTRWRGLGTEERQRFAELFKNFLEKNYIERIDSYSGEKVLVGDQEIREDSRGNRFAMVSTEFLLRDKTVPVIYRLIDKNGTWVVYDVDVEGVSLVRNFRTQFDPYPYAELIRRMEESIATGKDLEQ